jgi:histidinol-phosphate aminotransferase
MLERRKVDKAIVLAAGRGSRLVNGAPYPKPLKAVSNVAMLVRVLRTLQDEGIREAVIVTGYLGDALRRALLAEPSLVLELTFVHNPDFQKKNGVSLLAAREHVARGEDVLLTMADHLYSPEIVRRLRALELPRGASVLAVDFDVERCFDPDDATKVRVEQGRIADIGKEIGSYNAVDTGVFRVGAELLDELHRIYVETGDCSLSDGVRALAQRGRFLACDVGDARWIDVDTPAAMQRAEAMLRVFGDALGDEPAPAAVTDPEALELFAPTWVRAAQPYREDHFEIAAQRGHVDRLMSNESPFAPSQRVLDAIIAAAMKGNLYPQGVNELRGKLGRRESLDADHVLLGAGSTELIDLCIRTFVAPGEEALLSVPTFSMYEARTRIAGGLPVLVPMTPDAEFDVSAMISAVTERTKVLFVCTPNNPTGNRLQEAALRRLLRLGLPTVIDEAYYELGETAESLAYLLAEFPNAIVLRTFSKAFGLAGLRIGYALAHPAVIRLLSRVKLPWNLSTITVAAASAALDDVAEQDERLRLLREGRAYLIRELRRLPGVTAMPSEGNFVLVDLSGCASPAEAVARAMLERGVFVRTLAVHHASRSLIRITVGTAQQNTRCVDALRDVLVADARARGADRAQIAAASDAE